MAFPGTCRLHTPGDGVGSHYPSRVSSDTPTLMMLVLWGFVSHPTLFALWYSWT